jgi:hypothetical protein
MKIIDLWDITPCSLTEINGCFRSAYCSHYQQRALLKRRSVPTSPHRNIPEHIFTLVTMRTSNLTKADEMFKITNKTFGKCV